MAKQCLLVSSAEAAEIARPLFKELAVRWCNGRLEEQPEQTDIAIFGPAGWAEATAQQCVNATRLRVGNGDISEIDRDNPLVWLRDRIHEYQPSSAPEPGAPAPSAPQIADATAPEAEHHDYGDIPIERDDHIDLDEIADIAGATVRNASARKRAEHDETAEPTEWPEPEDQFDERRLPEWDYAWLPPAIEPFVSDQSAIGGWDAGMMGLQALVACAGCITDEIKLRVKPQQDWLESARLWGLYYGGKSIKKTPALGTVFKHVRTINQRLSVEHIKAMSRYAKDMKVYDEQERVWVKKKANNELGAIEPVAPDKPIDYQLVYEDFTTAALSDTLSTGNERGAIGMMDELAALWERLDSFSGGRGTERQDVLRLYNGGEATINRIGRGKVAVDNWSLSIIGGIQDDVLGRIVSKLNLTSDGMVQRFMPYMTARATMGHERAADEGAKRQWEGMLDCLYALRPHLEPVRFSPEAQLLRVEVDLWIQDTGEEFGLPLAITPFLDKFYGTFPRLCLTFWAIQCASERRPVIGPEIPLETCERAWRYLRDCIWQHALKLYSEALTADRSTSNGLRQLCTWLVCRDEIQPMVTLRDFAQQCKEAWYPSVPEPLVSARRAGLMNEMITHGWLRAANTPDKVGKLPTQYHVNPKIYERFAALRAEQMPKRKAAYAAIEARKAAKRDRVPGAD